MPRSVPMLVVPLLASVLLLGPRMADALVVAGEDADASERAPWDDPGWTYVGRLGGVTAVYLGDGWVLTAGHAGLGTLELGDAQYPAVPGSRVVLNAPGRSATASDLALFRVEPSPPLPSLELPRRPPTRGSPIVLVGYGFGRGEPLERGGYRWKNRKGKRWGTNRVSAAGLDVSGPGHSLTRCFVMDFSRYGTPHEAQAALGDSGGAVFVRTNDRWRLAGIILSVSSDPKQEAHTALFGNMTTAADLSAYRPQIRNLLRRGAGR